MGKNNRARRAAKVKKRAQRGERRPGPTQPQGGGHGCGFGDRSVRDSEPVFSEAERIAGLWDLGVKAVQRDDDVAVTRVVGLLARAPKASVEREAERDMLRVVGLLWANGWQPGELVRFVRRSTSAIGARLAETIVLADHHRRDRSTLDPAWAVQVDALDPRPGVDAAGWSARWGSDIGVDGPEWIRAALHVLAAFYSCGPLEELIAAPGSPRRSDSSINLRSAADPVLDRVRALLAQAESTNFEAEAEAFTAKAQELMTRHAIDLAVVAAATRGTTGGGISERPQTIRIPLDDPYADMKSLMLQIVAEVSRCRAIFHPRYSFTTVIGFAHDLSATQMLFTSLLVQAQSALAEAGRHAPPGARTRSRSFKSSFLLGYAKRVGERLTEINRSVTDSAQQESNQSLLPVLAARASVVDEEMDRRFADATVGHSRGGHDPFGYRQGSAAADVAQLSFADLSTEGSAAAPRGDRMVGAGPHADG